MSERLWKTIDEAALDAFNLSRRLESIADGIWPPGREKRRKGSVEALHDAAPDLLKACKALVTSYVEQNHSYALGELYRAREAARSAIAKAEGAAP